MPTTMKAVLGHKLGMTQVWDAATNRVIPVTAVQAGPCVVTQVKTATTDGYSAVQLAFGEIDPRKVNKPLKGHYAKSQTVPRRHLVEIRTDDAESYTLGQELGPDTFEEGQIVDVVGTSRGKGYAGVMKRHGFGGLGSSHGVHRVHRKPGSIGACATPARVFKGTRMAGRMGVDRVTTQNLRIVAVDTDKGVLLIKGAIAGPIDGVVIVQTAAKHALGKGGTEKIKKGA